jgi:MEMO1 family protein
MRARDTLTTPIHIRPAAVAGTFYPADVDTLRQDIQQYLDDAGPTTHPSINPQEKPIKAIIGPHAGYRYSGPVAASAYAHVQARRGKIKRVVLIGPAHRVPVAGLATTSASAFESPLGSVPIDLEVSQNLASLPGVHVHDTAHAPEHGLEVHLPFLIHTLSDPDITESVGFSIVPLLFGDTDWDLIAKVIDPFLDEDQTLVVISSDLSHYHNYDAAKKLDRQTADAILKNNIGSITTDRACGHAAIQGLLDCAKRRGLTIDETDLRNSGDTAGPREQVVGYGSFIVY